MYVTMLATLGMCVLYVREKYMYLYIVCTLHNVYALALLGGSRSVLLSSDQTDSAVSIDMDSVRRQQQEQMQVIEQQVWRCMMQD